MTLAINVQLQQSFWVGASFYSMLDADMVNTHNPQNDWTPGHSLPSPEGCGSAHLDSCPMRGYGWEEHQGGPGSGRTRWCDMKTTTFIVVHVALVLSDNLLIS